MYTIYQLKQYANKFLTENYGMTLSVPLQLNARLKKTCGWFVHRTYANGKKEPLKVELNKYFAENNEGAIVLDVLRHELVHYALYMQGRPHKDGHPVFESELKRLGVVSQSTINKYDFEASPKHIYQCVNISCNKEYELGRALRNGGRNHQCKCGGRLADKGKRKAVKS